jgi:hypothetical protein
VLAFLKRILHAWKEQRRAKRRARDSAELAFCRDKPDLISHGSRITGSIGNAFVVAVLYQEPPAISMPAPYVLYKVDAVTGEVTELDEDKFTEFRIKNYK